MCTLTYIPKSDGYILTHNRDERKNRPTSRDLRIRENNGIRIFYPEDLEAHGSWMAFADNNHTACILNGGSKRYTPNPPYRQSRGKVVLESLEFNSAREFYRSYNFDNLEPFTLIYRDREGLFEIVHDTDQTSLIEHPRDQINIWSSTTLYSSAIRAKRREWFQQWLDHHPQPDADGIRHFHHTGGDGDQENDLIMSRWGILQTLSITQITTFQRHARLRFHNLVEDSIDEKELILKA